MHKIVDVKCRARASRAALRVEFDCLTDRDEVKFVIANRGDYELLGNFIREHQPETRAGVFSFSGVLQDAFTRSHDGELPARSSLAGGMDARRCSASAAEPADSQIRMGAAEERRLNRGRG